MRLFAAQINPTIGDFEGNAGMILEGIARAKKEKCQLVLFPEMSICGYPPDDFLLLSDFMDCVEEKLKVIVKASAGISVIVGLPRRHGAALRNSAAIIHDGRLLGYQDKALLPTYDVFDERRYFESAPTMSVWEMGGRKVGVTICEDIWQHSELIQFANYKYDPILDFKEAAIDFLVNISASPFSRTKFERRLDACRKAAKTLNCPVILCNQVGGNDSLIFDGHSLWVDREGKLLGLAKGFQEDDLIVDVDKPGAPLREKRDYVHDIRSGLVLGLKDYFRKSGFTSALLGLSGGIDSALVACIAVEALGKENVLAVYMPSRFSSKGSKDDAKQLSEKLGIEMKEISIEGPFQSMLDLLEPHFAGLSWDVTEENMQARIRGMILMALSNKFHKIVLSTGNKSELAMGYATLYGDMCGGLGVISDLTKGEVYAVAKTFKQIPQSIIDKEPSAELKPNQKDSDSLPDYAIIDKVLEGYVENHLTAREIGDKHGFPLEIVEDIIRRLQRNEYKRRQSAPGLRISEKSFSVGYRFPIVQKFR